MYKQCRSRLYVHVGLASFSIIEAVKVKKCNPNKKNVAGVSIEPLSLCNASKNYYDGTFISKSYCVVLCY